MELSRGTECLLALRQSALHAPSGGVDGLPETLRADCDQWGACPSNTELVRVPTASLYGRGGPHQKFHKPGFTLSWRCETGETFVGQVGE